MKADMPSSGADWEALADVMSNEPVSVLADTVNERGEEGRVLGEPEKKKFLLSCVFKAIFEW